MDRRRPSTPGAPSPKPMNQNRSSVSWNFVGSSVEEEGSPAACGGDSSECATFYYKRSGQLTADCGDADKRGALAAPPRTGSTSVSKPRIMIPSMMASGLSRYTADSPGWEEDSEEGGCGLRHRRAGSGLTSSAGSAMPSPVVTSSPTEAQSMRRASPIPLPQTISRQQRGRSPATPASGRPRREWQQRNPSWRYDEDGCSDDGSCRYSADLDFPDNQSSWQQADDLQKGKKWVRPMSEDGQLPQTPGGRSSSCRSPLQDVSNLGSSRALEGGREQEGESEDSSFEFPAPGPAPEEEQAVQEDREVTPERSAKEGQLHSPALSHVATPQSNGRFPDAGHCENSPDLPQSLKKKPLPSKLAVSDICIDLHNTPTGFDSTKPNAVASSAGGQAVVGTPSTTRPGSTPAPFRKKGNFLSQSTMESAYKKRKMLAVSAPMQINTGAVDAPLPLPQALAERIQSLGTNLTSPQKNMLWLGIGLDCFSKISLLRELVRFARDDVGWFFMVLLFFLTTSTLVTVYWLHHYPPIAPELPEKKEPRVYGLTKQDVRRLVRRTGAIFSFLHLGTIFAALRSIFSHEVNQRRVAMDLRGMRLVDGLFLTLSLAIMQSYIAIRCSDDAIVCPGREGFDFFLGASIVASLFSGALSFLALDFNDVKAKQDKTHIVEGLSFFLFRLCELSCRAVLIALFAAVFGGVVVLFILAHVITVLLLIRFCPANEGMWAKLTTTIRVPVSLFCGRSLTLILPKGDDMKLLVAAMAWPPSCFVSDSTDAEGRFWWRGSLHVGRRTFWSLRTGDQILSFPVFQSLVLTEGCVMLGAIYVSNPGPWAGMYMEVVAVLMVLWCFFGMIWTSIVFGLKRGRLLSIAYSHATSERNGYSRVPAKSITASGAGNQQFGRLSPGNAPNEEAAFAMQATLSSTSPHAASPCKLQPVREDPIAEMEGSKQSHLSVPANYVLTEGVSTEFRARRAVSAETAEASPPLRSPLGRLKPGKVLGRMTGRGPKGKENHEAGAGTSTTSAGASESGGRSSPRPARVKLLPAGKQPASSGGGRQMQASPPTSKLTTTGGTRA